MKRRFYSILFGMALVTAVCGGCRDIPPQVSQTEESGSTTAAQTTDATASAVAVTTTTVSSATSTDVSTTVTADRTTTRKTTTKKTTAKKATTTQKATKTTTRAKTTTVAAPSNSSAFQQEVLRLVNGQRAANGLPALSYCYAAQAAADTRAQEILQSFSHTRPNGEDCFTALDALGLQYTAAGENIAMGQTTPQWVMEDWMNSSGHRANILNEDYNMIVVGYKDNAWVQLFLKL